MLFLLNYNYVAEYIRASCNILADSLSRLPLDGVDVAQHEQQMAWSIVAQVSPGMAVTEDMWEKAMVEDRVMQDLILCIGQDWRRVVPESVREYVRFNLELTFVEGKAWRGSRVVPTL